MLSRTAEAEKPRSGHMTKRMHDADDICPYETVALQQQALPINLNRPFRLRTPLAKPVTKMKHVQADELTTSLRIASVDFGVVYLLYCRIPMVGPFFTVFEFGKVRQMRMEQMLASSGQTLRGC
jgi:hypothetical protein